MQSSRRSATWRQLAICAGIMLGVFVFAVVAVDGAGGTISISNGSLRVDIPGAPAPADSDADATLQNS